MTRESDGASGKIEKLKWLCENSLEFLCKEILWKGNPPERKLWGGVHTDLEKFLGKGAARKAVLLPRNHLKSSVVTVGKTIQWLLRRPNARVLIVNQVWDRARDFLREIKEQLERSDLQHLYGPFKSYRWNEDGIIINQRRRPLREPSVMTTGVEAETTGGHFDYIILDDLMGLQNSGTPEQREKAKRFRRSMINLLEPDGQLVEIGCLVGGTKVLQANGLWKNIEEFKVGDKVVSHDSIETVEAMIPQGRAKVFEVKTKNFKLEATANHPFLTRSGFVRLEDLKPGDKVITLGSYDAGGNSVSSEEAWMLGFMIGDGWITRHPNSKGSMRWVTCFAKGVDSLLNQRALAFFKNKFGITPRLTNFGYYRTEVAKVGRYFERMGLIGKAKTKRVPSWMFEKNQAIKQSFLDGIIDADGTDHLGANGAVVPSLIELANKPLIEDLKYLALTAGRKASNIYSRTRQIKAPHSATAVCSETHHIGIGRDVYKERWKEVTIQSITPLGVKEVFDLTVSNTHNFVANGYVVHNTRWHLDDTFSEIFEKEHEYYDVMVRTIVEDGKLIFPEKFNQKFSPVAKRWVSVSEPTMDYVDYLKKSMPLSEFSAQYMNNPLDEENQIFRHEYMQWFDKRPNGLYVALTVDPAITEKVTADSTAMVVAGMDKDGKIYVLDYVEGKWASGAIIDNLFQKVDQWRPNAVGLESVGFQRTLKYAIEKEMVRRGKHFPIDELKAPTVGNGKEYRIKALEPFYRNKTIYHASWMKGKALETQLLTFPKGKHDDLIDALANQLVLLVPGHEGARQETKYMSGDWWMSQAKQFNGRNKDYFHYG